MLSTPSQHLLSPTNESLDIHLLFESLEDSYSCNSLFQHYHLSQQMWSVPQKENPILETRLHATGLTCISKHIHHTWLVAAAIVSYVGDTLAEWGPNQHDGEGNEWGRREGF